MGVSQVGPGANIVASPRILPTQSAGIASTTYPTTLTAVTGAPTFSFTTTVPNALVRVDFTTDIIATVTGFGAFYVVAALDGATTQGTGDGAGAAILYDTGGSNQRVNADASFSWVIPVAGSHTITFYAARYTASGTVYVGNIAGSVTIYDQLLATTSGSNFPALSTPPQNPAVGQGYYDTTYGLTRFWSGSVWQVGSGPATPYTAQMYLNTSVNITGATDSVTVPLDTVQYDPHGMCTTGSAAHFTAPIAGTYLLVGQVAFQSLASGTLYFGTIGVNGSINGNGGRHDIQRAYTSTTGAQSQGITYASILQLNAGDTCNISVYCSQATASNALSVGSNETMASLTLIQGSLPVTATTGGSWTTLPLGTGFTAYGGSFATPAYRIDANGVVWLRGLMNVATGMSPLGASSPANYNIGTLPAGYRPPYETVHIVDFGGADFARVDVTTTGLIQIVQVGSAIATPTTSASFLSLDGIHFAIF